MPRALFVCTTIVAAFQLHLAAASSTVEDAAITPPVAAFAAGLDVDPSRDRSRFMADMARLLYTSQGGKTPTFEPTFAPAVDPTRPTAAPTAPGERPITVPVPLSAKVWSRAVFRRTVPPDQLVAAILSDRRAALLCAGLSGVDDETLAYLAEHPAIVTNLYERASGVFAAFGGSLRIRDGRVEAPGGAEAAPLWEAVAQAPLGDPDRFVRTLFSEYDGRLAYLVDAIAAAEPSSARFALGSWIADSTVRIERFRALLDACIRAYKEWHAREHPFSRPLGDLGILLLRIRVAPSGAPAAPSGRTFWASVFDVRASAAGASEVGLSDSIDAAWLVAAMGDLDMYARTDRLDQFAFGQRVFNIEESASGSVADVLRSFRHGRMLMLTLERMGIRTPSVYAVALRRAEAIGDLDSSRRFWVLAQFQGGLSLVARMLRNNTIDRARGEALVISLTAVPFQDQDYGGGVAQWMRTQLSGALPAEGDWEDRAIAAAAGPTDSPAAPRLFWEGQAYRLDLAYAERRRMEAIRRKQGGHTLDLAIAIDDIGRGLRSQTLTLDGIRDARHSLQTLAAESSAALRHPAVNLLPPAVTPPRDGLDWIASAAEDLAKITSASDVRRAARVGASLQQLGDVVLGNALLSLAYAADMGDPEGPALLAGNVALRHDFGLARKDSDGRARLPWALPRQDFRPGVPWHISGSLLGLDIALAPLTLRRLSIDRVGQVPKISSIEREALAVSVALLEPARLTNGDRDAIEAAIGRGRTRVARIAAGADPVDLVADTLGMDGWRRRSLVWSLQHDPAAVAAQFSLAALLRIGGGAGAADLDAWGTPGLYSDGCACLRFPSSRAWRVLAGRPQLPMMAATMGDLNLAMAVMFHNLGLPAALAQSVLSIGMQEFIDDLSEANGGDWRSLSRLAQNIRRQRIEDYVSAAAVVDGALVPEEDSGSPRNH